MSYLRALSATLLSAATTFTLVTASGCGTSAIGVDDCRDIQQARCRAGKACGIVDDVAACERYYRDHCLHGLATTPPAGTSVAGCVEVIEAAGRCAEGDPEIDLNDCDPAVTDRKQSLTLACDVVRHPERANECAFLTDLPDTGGSAGQSAGGAADDGSGATGGVESTTGGESAAGGASAG
ncbi:MAG TPA: hypothetical protein VHB79_18530 [Polyangiaceae bacterium]|nr:hypothetical protein [Polyangiaceae bacterium]